MKHLTTAMAIILVVLIFHTASNSDTQKTSNQGKALDPSDNINTLNSKDVSKDQARDESLSYDKFVNSIDTSNSNLEKVEQKSVANKNVEFDKMTKSSTQSDSEHISASPGEKDSDDSSLLEETGDEDELLVDQMKRLSEKVMKAHEEGRLDMEIDSDEEKGESMKLDWYEIEEEVENFKAGHEINSRETAEHYEQTHDNIEQTDDGKFSEHDSSYTDPSHDEDISLTEQMKEKFKEINMHFDGYAKEEEDNYYEGNYLERETIHEGSQYLEPSSDIPILNTRAPLSDIVPSQTVVIQKSEDIMSVDSRDITADEILLLATSTPNDMPQRESDSVWEEIESTATVVEQSTTFLNIKNVGRNYRAEKKMANKKSKGEEIFDESHKDVTEFEAKTLDQQQTATRSEDNKELYPTETYKHVRHSATVDENTQERDQDIATSDVILEGTVLETATTQPPPTARNDVEDDRDKIVPVSTDMPTGVDEVPSMTQTLSQDQVQSESSTKDQGDAVDSLEEQKELTEEERKKIAQAQQYFEQGEKLVNNSYKKDYVQAYEYFKLAADLGHSKALEYLGFGHLLGDYISLDPEKALKIFTELSDKGSPRGQLVSNTVLPNSKILDLSKLKAFAEEINGLGFCYGSGLAVDSSQAKALIYFTFAALGGDPFAQMVLGYRYLSGIGVESKCETALQFYRKVATTVAETTTSGSPVIQRIRLHEQADNKDNGISLMDADLLQYYEFLADKGDLQAQVVLGQLYYQGGRGVPINHERAHHYFLMASESGNANAFAFLGKMHSEGSPYIKQDNLTAYQYFKKAGDKGNPIGLCGMGIMHLYGRGVEKDYAKALRYFSQSADQGWSDGQLQLGLMHYSAKGVKRDYKQAVRYLNLASQGGHVLAFFHLAQMHATGIGVMRNCHTAVELYKNVAERGSWASMLMEAHQLYKDGNVNEALLKYTFLAELGYEVAQTNVAYILDQGESSLFTEKETYQRALLQWTRAASQGSTVARLKMGDYHYYGYGTEIDYETAASHYRMATEQQHNAQAMFNLGYMHEQGLGLKQDVHLAKRFYDMAAETSGDAYVPVTLALIKLGLLYGFDVFNKELEGYNNILKRFDIRYQLGPSWDIYLATFLAIVLGIAIVIRRQR